MKFINIHTHNISNDGSIQLVNHQFQKELAEVEGVNFSVGIHPWDVESNTDDWFKKLNKLASNTNVLAIGECGIDRYNETPLNLQEHFFLCQVELAEELNKPIIIHAVKSYSDMIRLKKSRSKDLPWILHGYNGNLITTRQLLQHGFYFSFGIQLLKAGEKQLQSFLAIPPEKLFFETDVSHQPIETIYNFAAPLLGVSVKELRGMIYQNYKQIFQHG